MGQVPNVISENAKRQAAGQNIKISAFSRNLSMNSPLVRVCVCSVEDKIIRIWGHV